MLTQRSNPISAMERAEEMQSLFRTYIMNTETERTLPTLSRVLLVACYQKLLFIIE